MAVDLYHTSSQYTDIVKYETSSPVNQLRSYKIELRNRVTSRWTVERARGGRCQVPFTKCNHIIELKLSYAASLTMIPLRRPFQERDRLDKLQPWGRHRELPSATYTDLTSWPDIKFSLSMRPSKQLIGYAVKSTGRLRHFTADWLRHQRLYPSFQLLLDQCMVEYVVDSEDWGHSLSGSTLIAQARTALRRLNVPPTSWPQL